MAENLLRSDLDELDTEPLDLDSGIRRHSSSSAIPVSQRRHSQTTSFKNFKLLILNYLPITNLDVERLPGQDADVHHGVAVDPRRGVLGPRLVRQRRVRGVRLSRPVDRAHPELVGDAVDEAADLKNKTNY